MKGIVFTELIEMVETRFGPQTAFQMIEQSNLANGGAYTAVGTYDHHDILAMVGQLSAITGSNSRDLTRCFGEYLFERLAASHPSLIAKSATALELLSTVERHVHTEVRKLYPDAELPRFECKWRNAECLELIYHSQRPFGDLAEGLIGGCVRHFGEPIKMEREDLPAEAGSMVRFTLTKIVT